LSHTIDMGNMVKYITLFWNNNRLGKSIILKWFLGKNMYWGLSRVVWGQIVNVMFCVSSFKLVVSNDRYIAY
jgi:hypothetical protein